MGQLVRPSDNGLVVPPSNEVVSLSKTELYLSEIFILNPLWINTYNSGPYFGFYIYIYNIFSHQFPASKFNKSSTNLNHVFSFLLVGFEENVSRFNLCYNYKMNKTVSKSSDRYAVVGIMQWSSLICSHPKCMSSVSL